MSARQLQLADRLFEEAIALPPERRTAFLAENSHDPEVRDEVQDLLESAGGQPPTGIADAIGHAAVSLSGAELAGQRVGAYRLIGRIGHGGMGTVCRAVRDDDQFQQTVVIKMLRFAQGEPSELRRFLRERQILATLGHPYIAPLLDGGAWIPPGSAESQPFIVMEYVEGLPITAHCEEMKLSLRQRLRLFRQACEAIAYAHQRLIVHRDIKPGNILVTPSGVPKLLDFGIAKLLDPETGSSTLTAAGLSGMTPDYASPEQVRGDLVSTLTDVYSLGALLYEILTGRRAHQLVSRDPLEIAREVCEREMQPPSIVGGRHLRGDLDIIVLKAMQKDPARRYPSVEQFSEDIRRFLDGLPIVARPDTLAYRALKFAQRRRASVVGAAAVLLALTGGIAASSWQAIRATRAERTANAVNEFLENDLLAKAGASAQSNPGTKPDPDLRVRTALDRAAARIGSRFGGQPLVEASIRQTIGKAYLDLGLLSEARKNMERTLEIRRRVLGGEHPLTLRSMNTLWEVSLLREGQYGRAEVLFARLLAVERRVLGKEHPDTLNTMNDLATAYDEEGKHAQAEALCFEVLETRRRTLGEEHPDTLTSMHDLGVLYAMLGKHAQARALNTKVVAIRRRVLGEEHPDTLQSMSSLGALYVREGNYTEAEPLMTRLAEVQRRVLGENHPATQSTTNNLGTLYIYEGRYTQAEPLFARLLEARRKQGDDSEVLLTMNNLALVYRAEGKYGQSEALFTRILEVRRRELGEQHPNTLLTMTNLATVYRGERRYTEAEALYIAAVEGQRRASGEQHPSTLGAMDNLAMLYRAQRRYTQAAELFAKTLEARRRVMGEAHPDTIAAQASLGEVRLLQQKFDEAEPLLRSARAGYQKSNIDTWRRYYHQCALGATLAGQKEFPEAEPLLLTGYRGLVQRENAMPAENLTSVEQAREWMVRLYRDWGKPEKAAAWRKKAH